MSIIQNIRNIFAAHKSAPVSQEVHNYFDWPSRSEAQIHINEETAASVSTAWACGSLIARTIGQLPAHVMANRGPSDDDGAERIGGNVEDLLHRSPNPEMTAMAWRERMLLPAIFHGNSYSEIERDGAGRPIALWPIHPDRVAAVRQNSGPLFFEVDNGTAGKTTIAAADMFHLAGPNFDGPLGLSIISYARHSLGLATAQERYASALMANGARPSGIVSMTANLAPDGRARFKAELDKFLKGPRNAGKILVGDAGWKWEQVGLSSVDAEFLKQREFSVSEVCRWFGVPPQMIGDTAKQTFSNYSEAIRTFLAMGLLPWITRFEQEANRKLLRRERGRMPFLKINFSGLVRADLGQRYTAYDLGRRGGWLSANDVRRLEDLPPIGPEGDEYLIPAGLAPSAAPADDDAARQQASAPLLRFPHRER